MALSPFETETSPRKAQNCTESKQKPERIQEAGIQSQSTALLVSTAVRTLQLPSLHSACSVNAAKTLCAHSEIKTDVPTGRQTHRQRLHTQ